MRCKVRRYFVDAETGRVYEKGSFFQGRPERVRELQLAGLLGRTLTRRTLPKEGR